MADPTLELYDRNGGVIGSNDNWRTTQQNAIILTGVPPTRDAESAIVTSLPPGAYTAIVGGAVALCEGGSKTSVAAEPRWGIRG
jgi:hypothetical protein